MNGFGSASSLSMCGASARCTPVSRANELLDLGQPADVVQVVVRDDDVADVRGRAPQLFDRLEDAPAGTDAAGIYKGDVVIEDEVGLRALGAHLVQAGQHLDRGAERRGLLLFPPDLRFDPTRLRNFPAFLERGAGRSGGACH